VELLLDRAWEALAQRNSVRATTVRKMTQPSYLQPMPTGPPGQNGSRLSFVVRCLDRFITEKPKLVVFTHINLSPVALLMKALRPNTKLAIIVYGIDAWSKPSGLRSVAAGQADYIWSVSEYTRKRFITVAHIPERRVSLLPLSLPPELLNSLSSEGSVRHSDGASLLTVSRLDSGDRSKGIEHVLQALRLIIDRIPDVRYTVVGDGGDRSRLQAMARRLDVQDVVHFAGLVSSSKLALAYRACDVFVLPSNQEGFGLASLEAMAAGKPVVAAAAGATPEVVVNEVTGLLVPYGDVYALSQAICRLLQEPCVRASLGKQARQRAIDQFGFEKFLARLSSLLDLARN
jgi:phosphatidyl-myo-inositol dimannoside synthase